MRRHSPHRILVGVALSATVGYGSAHAGQSVDDRSGDTELGARVPVATKASPADIARIQNADPQGSLPKEGEHLRIDEKIGDEVPLDIPFFDSTGEQVTLANYLDGELPVILTFNYSSCPMLCSAQLRGLIESMNKVLFTAGEQYRVITIGIDHLETPETTSATKERYVATFPEDKQASVHKGWSFLSGKESDIRAMADSVGFPFQFIEDEQEYAHPASLIFLSPNGVVTRYYHGIYFEPQEFSQSIFQAGAGEHGVSIGFLLACLRPFHQEGHAEVGQSVMRYGALGFILFMLAAFGSWQMIRTRSARQAREGEPVGTNP